MERPRDADGVRPTADAERRVGRRDEGGLASFRSSAHAYVHTWGSTAAERSRDYPCDRFLADADAALYRAIDVDAPPVVLFRWLCQLKLAPYSYDWIDNFGRRSPRELVPGVERLRLGDRCMTFFELVDFTPDRQLTVTARPSALFGGLAVTYAIVPTEGDRSRLVVKLLVRYSRAPVVGWLERMLLPGGDLVMMRKQLLTLKDLAEHTHVAHDGV